MIHPNMSEEMQAKLDKKRKKADRFKNLGNRVANFLIMISIFLLVTFMCFIPLWIFLGVRHVIGPQGFWENIAILGLGVWALGGLQVVGLIVLLYFVIWILQQITEKW